MTTKPMDPFTPEAVQALATALRHIVDLAIEVSGWSPCRSKRGVVLFKGENVVTNGHNHKPRGFECDGSLACKKTCSVEAIHAEQYALMCAGGEARGADMLHVKTVDGALVASGGPSCVECSKLALAAGVSGFWLYHSDGWKRYDMAEFHRLSLDAFAARLAQEAGTCETCRHALPPFPDTGDRVCVKIYSRYGHAVVPLKGDDGRPFGCRGWKAKETL